MSIQHNPDTSGYTLPATTVGTCDSAKKRCTSGELRKSTTPSSNPPALDIPTNERTNCNSFAGGMNVSWIASSGNSR